MDDRPRDDQISLDWCFPPGVKLDVRGKAGYVYSALDVETELARIGPELQSFDIVLINTAAGTHYRHDDYAGRGCGTG